VAEVGRLGICLLDEVVGGACQCDGWEVDGGGEVVEGDDWIDREEWV